MFPNDSPENRDALKSRLQRTDSGVSPAGLIAILLALGVLVGFTLGWISFQSPWSTVSGPPVLYDESLVTLLVDEASPAVVEIAVVRTRTGPLSRATFREDSGSGFLVDKLGHIATNHHVVDGAQEITVRLFDGRALPASKLGSSPADDLALLRVDPLEVSDIRPLTLADSDKVRPGQMAVAIGSPFGHRNSVTVGVVSGVGRSEPSILRRPIPELVQTDAALNPGNSGGPLLDSEGQVIGVNSSVEIASSMQIGVGFAVPSNTLSGILDDLKIPGEVKRPWIGIAGMPMTRNMSVSLGLPAEKGIYVTRVWEGSPASKARLRGDSRRVPTGRGDIILSVDDNPVASVSDMVGYLNTRRPGDQVTLTILRDNRQVKIDLTLAEWPDTDT